MRRGMDNMRYLEILTYISLLAVSTVAPLSLVRDSHGTQVPQLQRIDGSVLSLPGVDWSRDRRTVVLAISSHCRYCSESALFTANSLAAAGPEGPELS